MKKYAELMENIEAFAFLSEAKDTAKVLETPFPHTPSNGKQVSIVRYYGPYVRKDGRSIALLQDQQGKTYTMSWPKWLMQLHLGKELGDLTIDHWDSDKTNNSLDNLKVIDRKEHSKQDTRRVRLVKLKCAQCGKDFERSPRLLRDKHKKQARGPFCSRHCSGQYNRQVQLGIADNLPAQDFVPSEYYKAKYEIKALADYLLQKYATKLPQKQYTKELWQQVFDTAKDYSTFRRIDNIRGPVGLNGQQVYEFLILAKTGKAKEGWAGSNSYAIVMIFPNLDVQVSLDRNFPLELLDGLRPLMGKPSYTQYYADNP